MVPEGRSRRRMVHDPVAATVRYHDADRAHASCSSLLGPSMLRYRAALQCHGDRCWTARSRTARSRTARPRTARPRTARPRTARSCSAGSRSARCPRDWCDGARTTRAAVTPIDQGSTNAPAVRSGPVRSPRLPGAPSHRPEGPPSGAPRSAAPIRSGRRVRVVEKFTGPRVRHRTGPWRRIRSFVGLVIIAIIVAAVIAAAIAATVGTIALAIQHALNNN